MNIVMITCAREPAYLDLSLQALFGTEPGIENVHVLVHEVEGTEVRVSDTFQGRLTMRHLTTEEHDAKMALGKRTRVCHAMRLALEMVDGECVFLEDDLTFVMSWLTSLQLELDRMPPEERDRVFVSLCSPLKHQREGFVRWNPGNYQGTVALFLGKETRLLAIEALKQAEKTRWPAPGIGSDVALRDFLLKNSNLKIQLLVRFPNLAKHMGEVSSIEPVAVRKLQAERAERVTTRPGRPPVTFPEKQFRPSQATPNAVQSPQEVTTKPRTSGRPPVSWRK